MKKVVSKVKQAIKEVDRKTLTNKLLMFGLCLCVIIFNSHVAHAGINTSALNSFDEIIDFILALVKKLGIGLVVWGAIDVILAMRSDSPEQKDKGQKLFLAGVGLICVSASGSYFKGM
ncbi:UNVERIFIED_ORG: hypothetical protein B2H98_08170 [Clostridium botulinum]|uniref:Maff2 family mobile element protein n=1 Tax=Clostridium sp. VAP23 TaxID=2949981 RepID=UPI000A16F4B3|nr:Maff2 family protein [Clostridium sp. VAP23]